MATGWTQVELDQLFAIMEDAMPPIPTNFEKLEAPVVTAMRVALTDREIIFNIETRGAGTSLYALNCWVAKLLAGEISVPMDRFNWAKEGDRPTSSHHIRDPEPSDLLNVPQVVSLAAYSEREGLVIRLAIGETAKLQTLYLPVNLAMEAMRAIGQGGTTAGWWIDDMSELLPRRKSQKLNVMSYLRGCCLASDTS
jgi:hypothetical protein